MITRIAAAALFTIGAVVGQVSPASSEEEGSLGDRYEARVFGMVCNQCAYGLEQALLHTSGVVKAHVDLKEGDVRAYLKRVEDVPAAAEIVRTIKDQGLTVKVLGGAFTGSIVEGKDGALRFRLGDATYVLEGAKDGLDLRRYAGKDVRLYGLFRAIKGVETEENGGEGPARFVAERVE